MAAPAQHIINELNEFMTAPALREIRSKYNSVRSQKNSFNSCNSWLKKKIFLVKKVAKKFGSLEKFL